MPFCPKCGKEVLESDAYCPNCGENLKKPAETPVYKIVSSSQGGIGNFSHAFQLAMRKPIVFTPVVIGSIISILITFLGLLLAGVSITQYPFTGSWRDPSNFGKISFFGGFIILMLIGSIITYIMFLASLDMSRDAYLDRPLDLSKSVRYVLSRLGTLIAASIIGAIFSATIILIPVAILMFVIIIVDEEGIGTSISKSFSVLSRRLGDILVILLIAIVGNVILGFIPVIGELLSSCLNVIIGISFIALYFEYKKIQKVGQY
ncbi:zinc-ribbon domain-containing protein [Candidatus Bathyarchaeota archaeon]|nr:zinc-ribbon domain-containing protein [Candidatus Bathyarchaeota archaeon]